MIKKVFLHSVCISITGLLLLSCGKKAEAPAADTVAASPLNYVSSDTTSENDVSARTNAPKDRKFKKTVEAEFKVKNVLQATEGIEDLVFGFGGYVVHSDLSNNQVNYSEVEKSRDSVLIVRQIEVSNKMTFKIPDSKVDSVLRRLKQYVVFLDGRRIDLEDVTHQIERNESETNRYDEYAKRQTNKIDSKGKNLKEISSAEDASLDKKLQADEARIRNKELLDDVKYCTLNIRIYQKATLSKETIENWDYIKEQSKPNILFRIGNAFLAGCGTLETILVFLVRIWSVILLLVVLAVGYGYYQKRRKNK